jgi:single-strand DNA-binding protein
MSDPTHLSVRAGATGQPGRAVTNQVRLAGRLAVDPVTTVLPSGDEVTSFRLVVPRGRADRRPPAVDSVDCAVWRASVRGRIATWRKGDEVEVEGSLRRRFWRGPAGPLSRYEVEVRQVRRRRS